MYEPPAPRPSPWRRGLALFLVLVILLGLGYVGYTHLSDIERILRGIPDNGWALEATQADALHALGLDGDGVVLCIVDTGIDPDHPEFAEVRLLAWRDLVADRAAPYDDHGHGTAMASLIVGQRLLPGAAPLVSLVVVKAVDRTGEGRAQAIADGIAFCMDPLGDGTASHIISLSLGGTPRPRVEDVVAAQVQEVTSQGVLVVASVGNEGPQPRDVQSPASEATAIGVGAVDRELRIAPFSQGGDNRERTDPNRKPEVVAPGVDLAVAGLQGTYLQISGTSAATALVSALLALILQGEPSLLGLATLDEVLTLKEALMNTARPVSDQQEPHDDFYGYGLVQAQDLLETLQGDN